MDRIVVIVGPSGVGKGTLISMLLKEFPSRYGFGISHTTRKQRPGEVDGIHYHFTTRETMLSEISEGKFIEHIEFAGNMYGLSKHAISDVLKQGKICILDLDIQGVESIKRMDYSNVTYVLIKPPSMEELRRRLVNRGETEENITKRLSVAEKDLAYMDKQPIGFFDYILVNDDLEKAYSLFKMIF